MSPARPRVLLIGPALPYRGGIAQHTTMLKRALTAYCDVRMESYSRQYPRLLFPGASERDPEYLGHVEPDTSYDIDSVNPLTWRRVARRALEWGPSLAVIPWWTAYWWACSGYFASRLRRAGVPVVVLCHNVEEHEQAGWKRLLARVTLGSASAFVVHGTPDCASLASLYPRTPCFVHPHPVYDQFPMPGATMPREHALELLFFGFVRRYKGLDVLLEALALLPEGLDVRLTVAGEFWHGAEEARGQISRLGIGNRVTIVDRYLPQEEVADYFTRADAIVLPYRSATGSGVVAIAYHYEKPVIVTAVGGLPDVVEDGVTGFVVPPEDPRSLADTIARLPDVDLGTMVEAARRFKESRLSWAGMARTVLEAGGASPVPGGLS